MDRLAHYSNPSHALSVLSVLNGQRLRGLMCDVILVVGNQRFHAHKGLLAASSEYFQSLFMDSESPKVINLDFCDPEAFEIVLNYIYSSSLFVDKGKLTAIQELGYSLGIPFLTNIASTKPNISYCVSNKRLSFSERDDDDVQTRSVIVSPAKVDAALSSRSSNPLLDINSKPLSTNNAASLPLDPNYREQVKNTKLSGKTLERNEAPATKSNYQKTRENFFQIYSIRPQLTSSVSFSDAEVPQMSLQSGADTGFKEEPEHRYDDIVPFQSPPNAQKQTIDRSGPPLKSLLKRSLSMDNPVPVFSPTLKLGEFQNREQSVVKIISQTASTEISAHNGSPARESAVVPERSSCHTKEIQIEKVCSKAEPSSPLGDPMDIVRITVGEILPVNLQDLQTSVNKKTKEKRKQRADDWKTPVKKTRTSETFLSLLSVNRSKKVPRQGDEETSDAQNENKKFKCQLCLKLFRSRAGLYRHINMYHNPEKPYVCQTCHKRFHTNYKVWTHRQIQHGVKEDTPRFFAVKDEKVQKMMTDIGEREVKKALMFKQSPFFNKKRLKTNFSCPFCTKTFVYQNQYRQHVKTHVTESLNQDTPSENPITQADIPQQKTSESKGYPCRLCNLRLPSLIEQDNHKQVCRYATVCPFCGLCFSSAEVKADHELHCKFKKLTCLNCMRNFKSPYSIWRHQMEVHNQDMMNVKDPHQLGLQENHNQDMMTVRDPRQLGLQGDHGQGPVILREEPAIITAVTGSFRENITYSSASVQTMYNSDEEPLFHMPKDLSMGQVVVKEEPQEEAVSNEVEAFGADDPDAWSCMNCGNIFGCQKDLERHQELLCHIKPFHCDICNKAFRTNFRLWSHIRTHKSTANEAAAKLMERQPPSASPSPPPLNASNFHPFPPEISGLGSAQTVLLVVDEEPSRSPKKCGSGATVANQGEEEPTDPSSLSRSNSKETHSRPNMNLYHAPSFSTLTFKTQHTCKFCHRTFKTPFSLWSHEQTHLPGL